MAITKKTTKLSKSPVAKSTSSIKAPLYNLKAEKVGDVTLPKTIFEAKVSDDLIARSVKSYLSNRRTAFAMTKERGDVAGTTKKMWAQKCTGRARHSSAKAGIFVGGGKTHGPRGVQNYTLKLNQTAKKAALSSLFTKFAAQDKVLVIDDFSTLLPKTKIAWDFMELLEKANKPLANSKKIGIITEPGNDNVVKAFRNIPGITPLSLNSLNVLDVSKQNILIFSQKAITTLK
jgi:large subunit ribosomal protein L4